jgi:hypothetical protein
MKFSPVHININKDNILQIQVIWTTNIAQIEDNITGQIALNHGISCDLLSICQNLWLLNLQRFISNPSIYVFSIDGSEARKKYIIC